MMQNFTAKEYVGKVLTLLGETMNKELSEEQKMALENHARNHERKPDDVRAQLWWIVDDLERGRNKEKTHARELITIRDDWAHCSSMNHKEARRAADTASLLLEKLGWSPDQMNNLLQEIESSGHQKPSHPPDSPSNRSHVSTEQIAIITCSKTQNPHATSAGELYTGPFYKLSRDEAEKDGLRFLIISRRDGLIHPDEPSNGPYDLDVEDMNKQEKQEWQEMLETQVKEKLSSKGIGKVVFLASQKHSEILQPTLRRHGIEYETHRNWKKICDKIFGRTPETV